METPQELRAEASRLEGEATALRARAVRAEREAEAERMRANAAMPVNRDDVRLTTGSPVPEDGSHTKLKPNGQQEGYVVLSEAERRKGFVRPVRDSYRHLGTRPTFPTRPLTDEEAQRYANQNYVAFEPYPEGHRGSSVGRYWTEEQLASGCGAITTMSRDLAETYARDPGFYGGTFCSRCGSHFRVGEHGEFVWIESDGSDGARVGT